jgi:hypothetical protein
VRQARASTRRVIDERGKNAKSRSGHSAGPLDVTLDFSLLYTSDKYGIFFKSFAFDSIRLRYLFIYLVQTLFQPVSYPRSGTEKQTRPKSRCVDLLHYHSLMYLDGHHAMSTMNHPTSLPLWASTRTRRVFPSFPDPDQSTMQEENTKRNKEHRDRWIVELREKRIALSRRVVSSSSIASKIVSQEGNDDLGLMMEHTLCCLRAARILVFPRLCVTVSRRMSSVSFSGM